ncbi:hypothetical protein B0H10DRAFT_258187 [Mycena sp. CBHHK59/15]|nr:hypothetical protein B0H10DRAFT_258187 [Mycena sp. CBHHK59/15]
MMKPLLFALLSTASLAVASQASNSTESVQDSEEPCKVYAQVRAEDLSPDHVSRGELRVKVKQAHCANQVASVVLRLQLDEFGEEKGRGNPRYPGGRQPDGP